MPTIRIHNKSDKPDNVVEKENQIYEECEKIERELPGWMHGYFMYLRSGILPMSRLSYLRELRFFCRYLISDESILKSDERLVNLEDIKNIPLSVFNDIEARDINYFIDYCRRYKIEDENGNVTVIENKNAALSHKKSALSVCFKQLYRDGLIEKNITDGFNPIRMPKAGEREIKALSDDEVMKMLDAVKNGTGLTKHELAYWEKTKKRDALMLLLLVTYGLRLSELQQLNVSSFNFERGEFKIYRKRAKEALMPINKTISEAFDDYIKTERPSEDLLSEENKDALLLSIQGTRLTERQIRQSVKKYSSIAMGSGRDQGYSPHKLRATAATSLIARGNSIYDVQELLDHDNVTTTQLYAKHKEHTKRELIKNFEWNEDL